MKKLLLAALLGLGTTAATQAPPANATVHIKNFKFVPTIVTVSVGSTVIFVNDDAEAHTATAYDRSFDSGGLDSSDTWIHRFSASGNFRYFCAMHPFMRGTIVVTTP